MCDQAELLELIARRPISVHEVADVDYIRLEQLIERLGRIAAELHRRDRPFLERSERVRKESLRAQLLIDLAERGLPVVEVHELHFGLNHDGVSQLLPAVREHGELPALDVDLEEIDILDLGNIVEPPSLNARLINDARIVLEEAEHLERGGAR